jgi:N-methylhydantoinase A
MTARVGIDIGGTFTDLVLTTSAGRAHRLKLPSTPHDYAAAIGEGLDRLIAEAGLDAAALAEVLHGTTIASNAILEGKGARTGLITTRGFRDILEIRTLRMPGCTIWPGASRRCWSSGPCAARCESGSIIAARCRSRWTRHR